VTPVASIVIPTYNQRPQYLAEAVNSALGQTVPNVEVIVVDDGSDEPPFADRDLKPENLQIIRHETNRGIAAALNTGIRASSAPWVCWLSSDAQGFVPRLVPRLPRLPHGPGAARCRRSGAVAHAR
jgi:glycosyltransferase involved in cell wall biosynthesis